MTSRRTLFRSSLFRSSLVRSSLVFATLLILLTRPAFADNASVRFTTTVGVIDVVLYADQAPETVANFLQLVDEGFYNGLIFHRVVAGFVIQAGGYDAKMVSRESTRTVVNESKVGLGNRKGTLAMARTDDPDSADSQFFINAQDNLNLNAKPGMPGYAVFGEVVAGMDVVEQIELTPVATVDGMQGVPVTPVVIEKAERI